ncbi:Zygote formation protein zyg1 [Fulvivirga sp. M361]|uniref:Zygote formation protein zyg1 n=1 Tax=Fulvivirga sp. M361 TaxID=2594266 RepID=UPI00117A4D41|nr:Zygote formation protein zyg1 [Fulvivirga sp. M361]TRX47252.1 Zygote formation protein zyg1 [Fulvivirga sp. M361]
MINSVINDKRITTLEDGGSSKLNEFNFVSKELNEKLIRSQKSNRAFAAASANPDGDSEQEVHFRLNQTGNIFYSTTSESIQGETKDLFDSVTVLFSAMTKALSDKGKNLFDYDSWGQLIRSSGFFVEVQKFQKTLEIKSSSLSIDTQVVQALLPGLQSGSSMDIAKSVLNALNGEYNSGSTNESTKLCHLLFICEEIFGAPSVTVRLFYATQESHTSITSSPCHRRTSTSFEQLQEADTFLFVSPETIARFASQFGEDPEAYTILIEKLKGYINEQPK